MNVQRSAMDNQLSVCAFLHLLLKAMHHFKKNDMLIENCVAFIVAEPSKMLRSAGEIFNSY
jgi:hypothetical protein